LALASFAEAQAAHKLATPTAQRALAWALSRRLTTSCPSVPTTPPLDENAAAVALKISADTEDALLQVFAPARKRAALNPETTWGLGNLRRNLTRRLFPAHGFDGLPSFSRLQVFLR